MRKRVADEEAALDFGEEENGRDGFLYDPAQAINHVMTMRNRTRVNPDI